MFTTLTTQAPSAKQATLHWMRKIPLPDEINSGQGITTDEALALAYANAWNQARPDLHHWIEPAEKN